MDPEQGYLSTYTYIIQIIYNKYVIYILWQYTRGFEVGIKNKQFYAFLYTKLGYGKKDTHVLTYIQVKIRVKF